MAKEAQTTGGKPRADAHRHAPPGEDPGTLTDEEYLSVGGPDALDAAAPPSGRRTHGAAQRDESVDAASEPHPDSPPQTHRGEDPERPGSDEPDRLG